MKNKTPMRFALLSSLALFFLLSLMITPTVFASAKTDIEADPGTLQVVYARSDYQIKGRSFYNTYKILDEQQKVYQGTNVSCHFEFFNQTGSKIYHENKSAVDGDVKFFVNGTLINSVGEYQTAIFCEDNVEGDYEVGFFKVIEKTDKTYEEYNFENIYSILLYLIFMGITLTLMYFMHAFKTDAGSSVVYGMIATTIQIILGGLILTGYRAVTLTQTISVNWALALLSFAIALYAAWYSTSLYRYGKQKKGFIRQ